MAHFAGTHALALYSALRANSQIFGSVVRRFATADREAWITIDDGPFPADTAALLEVLARHGAPATFFREGARVQTAPELARRIAAAGHSLGNHSHSHPVSPFWAHGPWRARRELRACSAALRAAAEVAALGVRKPGVTFAFDAGADFALSFSALRGVLPNYTNNVPRREFDALILRTALAAGARCVETVARLEADSANDTVRLAPETLALIPAWGGAPPT